MKETEKRPIYYHIDLIRFVFSVLIVFYHVLNASIIPYVTDPRYLALAERNSFSSNIVICFFIISGYFLYHSFAANPEQSIFDYMMGRVVRLWPVMVFAMLAESVLAGDFVWQRFLINGMFLQCSGLSLEYRGILWYISSFFFASIFLFAILRSCSRRTAAFLISLLSYFCTAFLINYYEGRIGGRETVLYVLNVGVMRGVAFIGVGILLAMIYERLSFKTKLAPFTKGTQMLLFCAKAGIDVLAIYFFYIYFLQSRNVSNHIVLVLVFALFLLCLVSKNDPFAWAFNRKIFGSLGKYAYSIYVMQGTSFLILRKTLWKSEALLSNVWLALAVSTLFPVAVGIAAYYAVEKPCTDMFRKWNKKYKLALSRMDNSE